MLTRLYPHAPFRSVLLHDCSGAVRAGFVIAIGTFRGPHVISHQGQAQAAVPAIISQIPDRA